MTGNTRRELRRVGSTMQSTTEGRVGLVGEISGFVVAEDQSLQARLERTLAQHQEKAAAQAARVTTLTREKAAEFRQNLDALRAAMPKLETPTEIEGVAGDDAGVVAPLRRRKKRFAGLLVFFWFAKAFFMQVEDDVKRLNRRRLGTAILVALSLFAVGTALLLPDFDDAPVAAETPAVSLQLAVVEAPPAASEAPAEPIKPAESWLPVKRPISVYNLEAPEIEAANLVFKVAMRGKTARQDTMTWTPRGDRRNALRPQVHLVVERYEAYAPSARPLYSEFAVRAADQGASIDRMNSPDQVPSKFGPLDVAEAVLSTDQGALQCLLFRRAETMGLVFAGWYCGTGQHPADRVSLTCFLDRLDLVSAGQDVELKRYFANAERNRRSCAGARQSGRRLTWLDHEAPVPALKLSAKTR